MTAKKTSLILLGLSSLGLLTGYILSNSVVFRLCAYEQYSCRELANNIGDPVFYGFTALAIVFVTLTFIPHAFTAWKKFAVWFVPLAALLFALYPYPGSGDFMSPYPEQVFQWVSALYILISLAIILPKAFKK